MIRRRRTSRMNIAPELVWGLVVRANALIYRVAFWSLRREVLALCGSRGLTPVAIKLARMPQDMGLARCLLRHPSFLWCSSCDAALVWLARAGMASAELGWAWRRGRCWPSPGSRLSFDVAIGITFPWESRLFEAGLLAILLPPLPTLPDVRTSVAPDPLMLAPAARSRL